MGFLGREVVPAPSPQQLSDFYPFILREKDKPTLLQSARWEHPAEIEPCKGGYDQSGPENARHSDHHWLMASHDGGCLHRRDHLDMLAHCFHGPFICVAKATSISARNLPSHRVPRPPQPSPGCVAGEQRPGVRRDPKGNGKRCAGTPCQSAWSIISRGSTAYVEYGKIQRCDCVQIM